MEGKDCALTHFRSICDYFLHQTKINFIHSRYGGWSFGLPLTNDLRFDVTAIPDNRTLAKVNYELPSGMSYN